MADEDLSLDDATDETTEGTEDGESKGSKKKLIIIAAAAAVLLIGGGIAAYFLIFSESDESTDTVAESEITEVDADADAEEEAPAPVVELPKKGEVIYISVPDPFLVNIKSGKRTRMMQIKVQFMVRSKEAEDLVNQHMPLVRNNMLDFFSLADAKEVQTREGRNALKNGALATAQKVMKEQAGFDAIEMVLFTGFVVQ